MTVDPGLGTSLPVKVYPLSGSQRMLKPSRFSLKLTKTSNMLDNLACETTYKKKSHSKSAIPEKPNWGPTASPVFGSPSRGPTIPKAMIAKGGPGSGGRPRNFSLRKIQKELEHCEGLSNMLKKSLGTTDINSCLSGQFTSAPQDSGSENDGSPVRFCRPGDMSPFASFAKARLAKGPPIKSVRVPKKRFRDYLVSHKKSTKAGTGLAESFHLLEEKNYGSNPDMPKIKEIDTEDDAEMVGSYRKTSLEFVSHDG